MQAGIALMVVAVIAALTCCVAVLAKNEDRGVDFVAAVVTLGAAGLLLMVMVFEQRDHNRWIRRRKAIMQQSEQEEREQQEYEEDKTAPREKVPDTKHEW